MSLDMFYIPFYGFGVLWSVSVFFISFLTTFGFWQKFNIGFLDVVSILFCGSSSAMIPLNGVIFTMITFMG